MSGNMEKCERGLLKSKEIQATNQRELYPPWLAWLEEREITRKEENQELFL